MLKSSQRPTTEPKTETRQTSKIDVIGIVCALDFGGLMRVMGLCERICGLNLETKQKVRRNSQK